MCPYHEWGDDDFDFKKLNKCTVWVEKFYRRVSKKQIVYKEKYGSIRYEFTWMWLKTKKDLIIFCEILRRAAVKFPTHAAEIVEDFYTNLDLTTTKYGAIINYYKGYFEGICWGTCHESCESWPKTKPYKLLRKADAKKA